MSEDVKTVDDAVNLPDNDGLPSWAREQITKANNEAAKYRTEKREAVEAAKAALTSDFNAQLEQLNEKLQAKEAEAAAAHFEVNRIKVAVQTGIEANKMLSFAELLKGDTEDELVSHAEELKQLFTTEAQGKTAEKATDPSQGSGKVLPLNGDPLLEAVTRVVNR